MSLRRLSNVFLGAGLVLGLLATVGYAFDLVPALPPAVLKLVIYKLVFLGAFGLIGFGALLGRLAYKASGASAQAHEPAELPEPGLPLDDSVLRHASREREAR